MAISSFGDYILIYLILTEQTKCKHPTFSVVFGQGLNLDVEVLIVDWNLT